MQQENNAEQWEGECLRWKFRNGAGVPMPECCQGISCCRNRHWLSQSSLSPITITHSPPRHLPLSDTLLFRSTWFFRKGATRFSRGIAETSGVKVNRPHVRVALRWWWERFSVSALLWTLKRSRQSLMSASENSKVCSERTTRTNLTGGSRHNENIYRNGHFHRLLPIWLSPLYFQAPFPLHQVMWKQRTFFFFVCCNRLFNRNS